MEKAVRDYMKKIGAKGGKVAGKAKRRGSVAYYKRISALGVAARLAKAAAKKGGRK